VRFVPYNDRKAAAAGLKAVYLAPSAELAACALDGFAGAWDEKYPMITESRRARWNEAGPFFKFSRGNQKSGVCGRCGRAGRLHDSKSRQMPPTFSEWRGGRKIDFYGLEKHCRKMDDAD
jgi:hypothetical protein